MKQKTKKQLQKEIIERARRVGLIEDLLLIIMSENHELRTRLAKHGHNTGTV